MTSAVPKDSNFLSSRTSRHSANTLSERALRRLGTSLPTFILGLSFTILLAATLSSARAQSVQSILDPSRITVGGQAAFTIESSGGPADTDTLPRQLNAPGLSINYSGHNSSFQIINGKQTARYSYVYAVRATRAGRFTIPPIRVAIGGKTFTTQAKVLIVEEPSQASGAERARSPYFLTLEVPERDLYVGEVVPLKLTLHVLGRNTISGTGQAEMERENLVMKRFPTSPQSGATQIDGRIYSTATLETSLFAIAEGKITIGPCSLPAMFYESQEYARIPSIFRRANRRTFTSNTAELNVKPLPGKGRPDDFSGAVGTFTLTQAASPTRLETGDPISVDLEIAGIGNFDSLAAPAFTAGDGWQLYPSRKLVQNLSDGTTPGKITYSQVIIPLEEKREIPPFRFSYFDPRKEEYVIAKSDPVPIEVAPDRAASPLVSAVETPGMPPSATRAPAAPPLPNFEDILTIVSEPPVLRTKASPLLRSPVFWAAQSIPALAFLGLLGTGFNRRYRGWRASRFKDTAPRTCAEIIAGLRAGPLSRHRLYREALACLEAAARTPGRSVANPGEFASLEATALGIVYGAGENAPESPGTPADPAETKAILRILEQLVH